MAYTTINKGSDYFNPLAYTGNNANGNSITGVGFAPDFVWIKRRSGDTNDNVLFDVVRGATKRLISNATTAETTNTDTLSAFNSDGFTVNQNDTVNAASPYIAWNWLAGGTAVSNTQGAITSQVSANNTSGFSIITWTGDGVGGTVGTGLSGSETIGFATVKKLSTTSEWQAGCYGAYSANPRNFAYHLELNSTADLSGASPYMMGTQNAGDPSLLKLASEGYVNGVDYVAYVWKPVKGFSKFGSYVGNGSSDGNFIYCGFKPAFILGKNASGTSAASENWFIYDNKRDTYNPIYHLLYPNLSNVEGTNSAQNIAFVSNGIKITSYDTRYNESGSTYIYMAFAENPFVTSTGTPVTAR